MTFPDAICKYNIIHASLNQVRSNIKRNTSIFHRSRASDEYKSIEGGDPATVLSPSLFHPSKGYRGQQEAIASVAVSDHDDSRPDDSSNLHGNLFVLGGSRYRAIARAECSFI